MSKFNDNEFNKELKEMAKGEKIEVPESLTNVVLDTLNKLPEREQRKNKYKYNYKKVAGFILAGLLTFNVVMPVYAEGLPLIGPTFKSINEAIGYGGKYVNSAKEIKLTDTYKNMTMTINNIYYDGVELAIAYEIKSESGFDKKPVIFPIIKQGIFKHINYSNEEHKGEFRDENTYVGLASYVFDSEMISDKTSINFVVNDIYGEWVGYYPEKFKFKLNLDAANMGKKTYTLNQEFNYNDSKFKISDVVVSPFNTLVYFNQYGEDSVRGKNELWFYALDDKGMPLEFNTLGASYKELSREIEGYCRLSEVNEGTESITIIPTVYTNGNGGNEVIMNKINKDKETIVELGDRGKYIIENIDFQEDKTIININVKAYLDRIDNSDFNLCDEDNNYIEEIKHEFKGIDEGYKFTLTLPKLDSSKDYYIPVSQDSFKNTKILTEESITIDLTK